MIPIIIIGQNAIIVNAINPKIVQRTAKVIPIIGQRKIPKIKNDIRYITIANKMLLMIFLQIEVSRKFFISWIPLQIRLFVIN